MYLGKLHEYSIQMDFDFLHLLNMQIPYNGNGEVITPVLVHSGEMSDKVIENFYSTIQFVHTRNGGLNYDVPVKVLEYIQSYVNHLFIIFVLQILNEMRNNFFTHVGNIILNLIGTWKHIRIHYLQLSTLTRSWQK